MHTCLMKRYIHLSYSVWIELWDKISTLNSSTHNIPHLSYTIWQPTDSTLLRFTHSILPNNFLIIPYSSIISCSSTPVYEFMFKCLYENHTYLEINDCKKRPPDFSRFLVYLLHHYQSRWYDKFYCFIMLSNNNNNAKK